MRRYSQTIPYLLLVVGSCLCWMVLGGAGLLRGVEQAGLRLRYLVRGPMAASPSITYVNLDAQTVSYMGSRPWDRREFGRLLEALLGPGGARVVGVDIVLSKFGASALLDLERARKGDQFLGQVVRTHQDRVVLAAAYSGVATARGSGETAYLPLIREGNYLPQANPFPEAPTFPIINYGVGRLGLVNVDEDLSRGAVSYWVPGFVELEGDAYSQHLLDGVGRHFYGILNEPRLINDAAGIRLEDRDGWAPQTYPSVGRQRLFTLGLEMFLAAEGLSAEDVEIGDRSLRIVRAGQVYREVPLADAQSIEINWMEGWASSQAPMVSMREVLEQADALGRASREGDEAASAAALGWLARFRDRVVLVGPVDPLLKDLAPTPFDASPVPKVAVHGNLYRTLEDQAYIRRTRSWAEWCAVVLLTGLVSWLILRGPWGRAAAFAAMAAYVVGVFVAFSQAHWVLPLAAPLGSALSAGICLLAIKVGAEQMQRRRIKALFSAYVSPSLVDQMLDSAHDPELGGAQVEVSALFSDIEGFSLIAEALSPERLVALMNDYLGVMTETFQAHGGTLDKYVGDAIVTMFGMPYPVEDHAAQACLSAIAMQAENAKLRARLAASGDWPERVLQLRTRIGINSGEAVVGNMGSRLRFNYTMMGDSVNLAARCESVGKFYGVYTIITEATYLAARARLPELFCRRLDRIVVQGRTRPVEIYELWDGVIPREAITDCWARYEAAFDLYLQGDWAGALAGFETAAVLEPAGTTGMKTPSSVMAARCRDFMETGAPDGWEGAYRMPGK